MVGGVGIGVVTGMGDTVVDVVGTDCDIEGVLVLLVVVIGGMGVIGMGSTGTTVVGTVVTGDCLIGITSVRPLAAPPAPPRCGLLGSLHRSANK